jgi:glutathione S-transferase
MLKLYHGPTSVCSQKVRLAIAEIGLEYDGVLLDLQKGEQFAPEYMRLNPDAVVPTLIDGDLVVLESSLIIEYLDKVYNGGRLMPDDTRFEVRTRHWLVRCLAVHAAVNTLSFSTFMRDKALATRTPAEIEASIERMPDPVARMKRRDLFVQGLDSHHVSQALLHLKRTFGDMSADIADGDWVSGKGLGLADIGLAPYVDRIDRLGFAGLWEDRTPVVGTWLDRMRARPSYMPAIEAFIPEEIARAQRREGEKHWPSLADQWRALQA